MANKDNPSGFTPVTPILSANYYVKSTNAIIYPGEMLMFHTDGKVRAATTTSTNLIGVAAQYRLAADTDILVYDDADQKYYIQDDGVGGTLAATDVNKNIDILVTAGNATFLKARHELDTNGVTSATAQMRILAKHPDDTWADNVRCLVVINEHAFGKSTAGVA